MPSPNRRASLMTLLILLLVAGLGSCGLGGDGGSLRGSGDLGAESSWCLPDFEPGGDVTHGTEVLTNDSDEPVEVTGVSLVGSEGFDLVGAYLRPADVRGLAGTLSRWPPTKRDDLTALGAVAPGERVNLVLHLRPAPDAARAALTGVEVDYRADGDDHRAHGSIDVRWTGTCRSLPRSAG